MPFSLFRPVPPSADRSPPFRPKESLDCESGTRELMFFLVHFAVSLPKHQMSFLYVLPRP